MYLALAAPVGMGFPEMLVVYAAVLIVPQLVLWKFYQALSRIANELAEIKQALRSGKPL